MSKELDQILNPSQEIPWDEASAFFVAIKETTIEKTAATKELTPEQKKEIWKARTRHARSAGILSGVRSSAAQDITHAERVKRTRGTRMGREAGTLAGAAAGFMAGRKGGVAGKIGGTALGALIGRGAGKAVGEEVDRSRTRAKYGPPKSKKAEMEKHTAGTEKAASINRVRELWKLAQGEAPTEAMEGASGAVPSPPEVEPTGLMGEEPVAVQPVGLPPPQKGKGGSTPEDRKKQEAMAMLEQEAMADEVAQMNEADFYRAQAEQAGMAAQEMQGQLQQAQMQAEQAGQQAQMAQMQADQAVQQSAQQAQVSAQQNQQLSSQLEGATQENLAAKQNMMQMRQAMQAYRENLQQLALQDPTAMAGPSPEEQGMPEAGGAPPLPGEAGKEMQEAQKAEQEAQLQGAQAEEAAAAEQAKQQAAAQGQVPEMLQASPEEQAAAQQGQVKQSSVGYLLPFGKTASYQDRLIGAGIGALGGAALQHLTDRAAPGQPSEKERTLRAKLQHLQAKKEKSPFDKHMVNMTRALYETAKVNRQHPGSAAAMGAITGAVVGAAAAPLVKRMGQQLIRR